MKGGNVAETMTEPHVSYNIFKNTAPCFYQIAASVRGLIVANNTFIGCNNTSNVIVSGDNNGSGWINSILCLNNHFEIVGNIAVLSAGNVTSRNNTVNKNGYIITIPETDFEIETVINSSGVPASKIEHAETITGDNATGLDSNYVIPSAITYQNQGETWQNGAVILP